MNIIIFEDNATKNFEPLIHTRSIAELKLGTIRLYERVLSAYDLEKVSIIAREEVKGCISENLQLNSEIDSNSNYSLFINASAVIEEKIENLHDEVIATKNNRVVYAYLKKETIEKLDLQSLTKDFLFSELNHIKQVNTDILLLEYYWDIIRYNGEYIKKDFEKFYSNKNDCKNIEFEVADKSKFYLGKNTEISKTVVVDTTSGAVIIGDNVKIEAYTYIKGPVFIGDKTEIKPHSQILSGTSIHYNCRIGGEVNNSIFHSFSNKGHHGFVGHAYVGKWVNFGAGSTNSNLKNNYGYINVYLSKDKSIKTDMQYLGPAIGDYCKFSINSSINSGSIFGFSANVFSSGELLPKRVENFAWGKEEKFELTKAIDCAINMMERRGESLSDNKKERFKNIYENC